jgi:hypothetical protein
VTDDEVIGTLQEAVESDEMRDMFMKIREMTFESEPTAFIFYKSYARDNGFSIRKDIVKYRKGESKHLRVRRFVCSRGGKRDNMLLTEDGRSRRLIPESRCNCEAHLSMKFDKKRGVWWVSSFEDKHNHILAKPDEVPFLWSHRKIKECQKSEILSMGAVGIRTHTIMDSYISKHYWKKGLMFRTSSTGCVLNRC